MQQSPVISTHHRQRRVPAAIAHAALAHEEASKVNPTEGFRSFGEFVYQVKQACTGPAADPRLVRAATTFGSEGVGPSGDYAVPSAFAQEIASLAYSEGSLLPLCSELPISSSTVDIPRDETTPWGSTGIVAAWEGEGGQSAQSKPDLDSTSCRLRKLKTLVPITDELLEDSPAMEGYLKRVMSAAICWKINDAIINGTGAGVPLGILKAPSLIVQAKEGAQTADTINAANVTNMLSRAILTGGGNIVWLINPDAYGQVMSLVLNESPIWTPGTSVDAPNGLLLGRPIVLTDACQTLGDQGDIILANMSGYQAVTRAGGAVLASSMHLWFDQDITAFRLTFRMDGQPLLSAAVTPPHSTVTRSHFVTLAVRA